MKSSTLTRSVAVLFGAVMITAAANTITSAVAPRFYDDDPVWKDADTQTAKGIKPLEVDLMVDLTYNLIASGSRPSPRAANVNTIDEVPDSSWFTNRIGSANRPRMTAEEIAVGPDTTTGPAAGAWTITSSKSDGVTPGFTIRDANNQAWFLKFDPPGYRAMATGTEVVVTKLMWALGYNVPENHIAYLKKDQLVVGEGAKFTPAGGTKRLMRREDIDKLLERANREKDGSFRVVASKPLPGKPIGRIRFFGTRPDDPNDVVPHEDRRELRAYGTFAAWLNHVDAKAINSLDTLVVEDGREVVRHNLLDFGSALGSGGVGPADYWEGAESIIEPSAVLKRMVSFGFYLPEWRREPFYESKAIGRLPLENANFNPEAWKPRVPNRAFLQARADDKFWAAQRLAAFTTDLLAAAVKTGDFGDPAAAAFLVKALAGRRDAILKAYLGAINPVADLALDASGRLTFRNAAVDADTARVPRAYQARWSTFDNATGDSRFVGDTSAATNALDAPAELPTTPGTFVAVEISGHGSNTSWEQPVTAHFRRLNSAWKLVGFNRLPDR